MELRETETKGKFELDYDHDTAIVTMFPAGVADNFEEIHAGDKRIFRCITGCYVEYVTIGGIINKEIRGQIYPGTSMVVNLRLFLTQD